MDDRALGDKLIIQAVKQELTLSELEEYLYHESSYVWSSAIFALGKIGGRRAYDLWIGLLENKNKKVIEKAIFAAGDLQDSRCIFPMANIYIHNNDTQLRFAVVNTLEKMQDPRGTELLNVLQELETHEPLKSAIENCIKAQDYSEPFIYTFNGPEEKRLEAMENEYRLLIKNPRDLDKLLDIWEQLKRMKIKQTPETYIIDENQNLYLGGYTEEHVKVAKGKGVLAAGEMELKKENKWEITYINNRSYGYYPAANSYSVIKPVLESTGIKHPDKFTETFPKEGYFSEEFLSWQPLHPKKMKDSKSN